MPVSSSKPTMATIAIGALLHRSRRRASRLTSASGGPATRPDTVTARTGVKVMSTPVLLSPKSIVTVSALASAIARG